MDLLRGIACGLLPLVLTGCLSVPSKDSVIGAYTLTVKQNRIALSLSPDGKFSESIHWSSGTEAEQKGFWWMRDGVLSFDKLWIPPEFAPEGINQIGTSAGFPAQPKFTDPGRWSLSPEWHLGRIVIEVFPDDDVTFRKVN